MAWFRHSLRGKTVRIPTSKTRLAFELLENRIVPGGDPSITLVLANHSIPENAGANATTGTVTRINMDTTQALTIQLESSNTNQATVPASVTIPSGSTSTTFNVSAVDDHIVNPPQLV